jgi:hypothetical protein
MRLAFAPCHDNEINASARRHHSYSLLLREEVMDAKKLEKAAKPKALGDYLAAHVADSLHDHEMKHRAESVRVESHDGHQFTIHTTYHIEVDGKPLEVPLMVDQDGQVHCHALPNYQFQSAVDMIKVLIDTFPDDFPTGNPKGAKAGRHHHAAAKPRKRRKRQ